MQIDTRVAGIPCIVDVTYYEPITPGRRWGHIDNWTPDEGGELEYTICDRRGRTAPWLTRKVTDRDTDRLKTEIWKHIKETENEY
jgi:hypothetical protein